jgi:hypothetical protein
MDDFVLTHLAGSNERICLPLPGCDCPLAMSHY